MKETEELEGFWAAAHEEPKSKRLARRVCAWLNLLGDMKKNYAKKAWKPQPGSSG